MHTVFWFEKHFQKGIRHGPSKKIDFYQAMLKMITKMSIECIVFTIMLIIAEYFNTAWQTSIFFSKNRCVIHFWNRFLNQKNMCLIFGPFSKLFEQPMIITQPYYPISHPLSMYNPGRRYFDILRYHPGQRYFGI